MEPAGRRRSSSVASLPVEWTAVPGGDISNEKQSADRVDEQPHVALLASGLTHALFKAAWPQSIVTACRNLVALTDVAVIGRCVALTGTL